MHLESEKKRKKVEQRKFENGAFETPWSHPGAGDFSNLKI